MREVFPTACSPRITIFADCSEILVALANEFWESYMTFNFYYNTVQIVGGLGGGNRIGRLKDRCLGEGARGLW